MKIGRLFRTVRYLKPEQLGWRAIHELRLGAYRRWPRISGAAWRAAASGPASPAVLRIGAVQPGLLARERDVARRWADGQVEYHGIAGDRFDWCAAGMSRLWRYERHYHSELVPLSALAAADQEERWAEEARALIQSWLAVTPLPQGDAWEPYPVARRILNWSLALALLPRLGDVLAPSMGVHLRFLRAHLERHLLGNHLLCDAAALMAGGAVLQGRGLERVARLGEKVLTNSLRKQVLADGGYAERTVQYHAIVLRDALLAVALTRARGREVAPELLDTLRCMAGWLRSVQRPVAPGPWLNDAAPDACPPLDEVLSLAAAVGPGQSSQLGWLGAAFGGHSLTPVSAPSDVVLRDTGWAFVREAKHELLFDHGPIGPDEQPGHGHSDALSFELVWDGVPIVTDSGVTTYDVGHVRDFERSAPAHATLTVDGEGPDELWASFRVGARGRVAGGLSQTTPEGVRILDGRVDAWQGWSHRRRVIYWPGEAFVVLDRVDGTAGTVLSRVPLDPCCGFEANVIDTPCGPLQFVVLRGIAASPVVGRSDPREGWVGDGFSRPRQRPTVLIHADGECRVAYAILAPGRFVILSDGACTMRGPGGEVRLPLKDHE